MPVFKSFKNHTRLTRIYSNGPSVSRIRPRFIRLYVRFTRVANRVNRVFCVRRALGPSFHPFFINVVEYETSEMGFFGIKKQSQRAVK